MVIDGKAIAAEILDEVKTEVANLGRELTLTAVTCAPNFETKSYLEMKKRKAKAVGVALNVVELPEGATTSEVITAVTKVVGGSDGVVVQLPLPERIDRDAVLRAIAVAKDPDGFAFGATEQACLPPVVAAIDLITKQHGVVWDGAQVAVLGHGRLVGAPTAIYAATRNAQVQVMDEATFDPEALKEVDILVSGVGRPYLVKPEMVREGIVVFDAGTSEDRGELVGDVDPAVAEKAALMTPVPGGIGPITVACLLRNLVHLARR